MENTKTLQLKISLTEISPEIWRRILISDNASFDDLHHAIQAAMGWQSYHKYEFEIGNETITCSEEGFNLAEGMLRPLIKSGKLQEMVKNGGIGHKGMLDTGEANRLLAEQEIDKTAPEYDMQAILRELVPGEGEEFTYTYDFGDNWMHRITVEKIHEERQLETPECIAGERACPPEDCGGTSGYENFLKAISDKKHPEHKEMLEWAGGYFDPEKFNLEEANLRMQLGYAALSAAGEMIQELEESSYKLRSGLVQEIISNPATVPLLVDIIENEERWNASDPMPIHAIHLLTMMKAPEAVKPILRIMKEDPDRLGDFLTEDMGSILYHFGEKHIGDFIEFLTDKDNDSYARNEASNAVAMLANKNKSLAQKVVPTYTKIFKDALKGKEDPEFISFIVEDASSLQDEKLFGLVKQAFEKKVVTDDITDLYFSEDAFREGKPYLARSQHLKNPVDYFENENMEYLYGINNPWGGTSLAESHGPAPHTHGMAQYNSPKKPQKIGMNQKCPCGSGKKFKKCCLGKGIYDR